MLLRWNQFYPTISIHLKKAAEEESVVEEAWRKQKEDEEEFDEREHVRGTQGRGEGVTGERWGLFGESRLWHYMDETLVTRCGGRRLRRRRLPGHGHGNSYQASWYLPPLSHIVKTIICFLSISHIGSINYLSL